MNGIQRPADVNVNEIQCAADADRLSAVVTAVWYSIALGVWNRQCHAVPRVECNHALQRNKEIHKIPLSCLYLRNLKMVTPPVVFTTPRSSPKSSVTAPATITVQTPVFPAAKIAASSDSDSSPVPTPTPMPTMSRNAVPSRHIAVITNELSSKPPIISSGKITLELVYLMEKAFKGFFQYREIEPIKQVARCMYSFQDHHIEQWFDTDWDNIVKLTFAEFMSKFCIVFLPTSWEADLKSAILSMRQGNQGLWEWYNAMTVKNMLLHGTSSHCAIKKICEQLTANRTSKLSECVRYEGADDETDFKKWIESIRCIDDYQAAKRACASSNRAPFSEPSQNLNTMSSAPAASSTCTMFVQKPKLL